MLKSERGIWYAYNPDLGHEGERRALIPVLWVRLRRGAASLHTGTLRPSEITLPANPSTMQSCAAKRHTKKAKSSNLTAEF